jgi:hypothetical protein
MPFQITATMAFAWPDEATVEHALGLLGLTTARLHDTLRSFADNADPAGRRYTETLAANLADHLRTELGRDGLRGTTRQTTNRYSSRVDYHADLTLSRDSSERKVFFEVEFRPNFEKDLIKFRIGHLAGRLALGVLIVATDRRGIRGTYTSMPQFNSVTAVVGEYRPDHPVLVFGIETSFNDSNPI